jgi:hypothetical protein
MSSLHNIGSRPLTVSYLSNAEENTIESALFFNNLKSEILFFIENEEIERKISHLFTRVQTHFICLKKEDHTFSHAYKKYINPSTGADYDALCEGYLKLERIYRASLHLLKYYYFCWMDHDFLHNLNESKLLSSSFRWPKRKIIFSEGEMAFSGSEPTALDLDDKNFFNQNTSIHTSIFILDRKTISSLYRSIKFEFLNLLKKQNKIIPIQKFFGAAATKDPYKQYAEICVDPGSKVDGSALFEDHLDF